MAISLGSRFETKSTVRPKELAELPLRCEVANQTNLRSRPKIDNSRISYGDGRHEAILPAIQVPGAISVTTTHLLYLNFLLKNSTVARYVSTQLRHIRKSCPSSGNTISSTSTFCRRSASFNITV
jgi:hypothetical protein